MSIPESEVPEDHPIQIRMKSMPGRNFDAWLNNPMRTMTNTRLLMHWNLAARIS